jgi:hypothetical protein
LYTQSAIERILKKVSVQKLSAKAAFKKLRYLSYESFDFANIDHHRRIRKNLPEVIFSPGKTFEQLKKIIGSLSKSGAPVLATRLSENEFRKLKKFFPKLCYSRDGRVAYLKNKAVGRGKGLVAVVTAGTSDIPVAEEAAITLEIVGKSVKRFYDCGVAGLHRLLDHIQDIEKADVIICVAGMEGALSSVMAGLVSKPIIAVPTSVGYGANFKGVAPLLTMMNSCAQGVVVVNIDSGFNAACFASLVLDQICG